MNQRTWLSLLGTLLLNAAVPLHAAEVSADGWTSGAPRAEIRPDFSFAEHGGRNRGPGWKIMVGSNPGILGYWRKTFPVTGGHYYHFSVFHRAEGVATPRRSVVERILWQDAKGDPVIHDAPTISHYYPKWTPPAEAEYPEEGSTDADGWTEASETVRAPETAVQAVVELDLQWTTHSAVTWSDSSWTESDAPPHRYVRLAAAHLVPQGGRTPMDNCRMYEPSIAAAGRDHADLIVLGEWLTTMGLGEPVAAAEPIPGPSTRYFGSLAARYSLYLVAGLVEREGPLVYNTAVLLGPDGTLLGKYRKTTISTLEIEAGLTPGDGDYPVFNTRFGKLGLMVCYDAFFPDAARHLSEKGAEVIAWPVYSYTPPLLASARAFENQVYLVSSTYADAKTTDAGVSAIYDREGKILAHAEDFGQIAEAVVDLNDRTYWTSLGDFRGRLPRHRPVWREAVP